jgi:hypothetical protein
MSLSPTQQTAFGGTMTCLNLQVIDFPSNKFRRAINARCPHAHRPPLCRRADLIATNQHCSIEVQLVPISQNRAAHVDACALEANRLLFEKIISYA